MTGPYVVKLLETRKPDYDTTFVPWSEVVSVKAFETLEEVRDWVIARLEMIGDDSHHTRGSMTIGDAKRVAQWMTEPLTLSPLPGGREITVELVEVPSEALPGATVSVAAITAAKRAIGDGRTLSNGWPLTNGAPAPLTVAEWVAAFNTVMAERYAAQEGR